MPEKERGATLSQSCSSSFQQVASEMASSFRRVVVAAPPEEGGEEDELSLGTLLPPRSLSLSFPFVPAINPVGRPRGGRRLTRLGGNLASSRDAPPTAFRDW